MRTIGGGGREKENFLFFFNGITTDRKMRLVDVRPWPKKKNWKSSQQNRVGLLRSPFTAGRRWKGGGQGAPVPIVFRCRQPTLFIPVSARFMPWFCFVFSASNHHVTQTQRHGEPRSVSMATGPVPSVQDRSKKNRSPPRGGFLQQRTNDSDR